MRMRETPYAGPPPIDAYGAGGFRVGGARWEGGLLIGPDGPVSWPAASVETLDAAAAAPLIAFAGQVDVAVIGVGEELRPLPAAFREALESAGIGVEPMATASACRTYNVLLGEGRAILAALIAV